MSTAHSGSFTNYWAQTSPPVRESQQVEIEFQLLKEKLHEKLISSLDLVAARGMTESQIRSDVVPFIQTEIRNHRNEIKREYADRLLTELQDEMFGLGPLEPLFSDPTISDILVNHPFEVFIERNGVLELTDISFADHRHLTRIIQRIVSRVGRRIDEVCPMVDARLPDGSRVNAVIPPLALDGPKLSIRRFGKSLLPISELIRRQTIPSGVADFLKAAVKARISIMISGGTGAGKTTLLNALSAAIPDNERIVTIEDSAELMLQHRHVARMESRPANSEGTGEITLKDLVRNSLRMRPDRIIVGEVRGSETLDMLQAMNTGHDGSLTTVHANDAVDALGRIEMMVAMAKLELPLDVIRSYIASGIGLIVHVARLKGGVRRVTRVAEIRKCESNGYRLRDIFEFKRTGTDPDGRATGEFHGYESPNCLSRIVEEGIPFDWTSALNSLQPEAQSGDD